MIFREKLQANHRMIFQILVRYCNMKPDTFIYIARDMGYSPGICAIFIRNYYNMSEFDAKTMAFNSQAWGEGRKVNEQLHDNLEKFVERGQVDRIP
ncbi:hypothetical protein RB623_06145 [Mesorhizobium sp. LHD-90]|uniref:hypothetical protein n=1 Tax=Mesorhizobium sp. LHD-90 TaxID=3071414 RepID=UPI0027DF4BB6|nr:hypothetical protein [Mesorhizobium sp. LHD-90]MDQ6433631.1 hypothetical protein [Mesorhizobium sp. LHD-90]